MMIMMMMMMTMMMMMMMVMMMMIFQIRTMICFHQANVRQWDSKDNDQTVASAANAVVAAAAVNAGIAGTSVGHRPSVPLSGTIFLVHSPSRSYCLRW